LLVKIVEDSKIDILVLGVTAYDYTKIVKIKGRASTESSCT
jgi:hypothetical protein